MGHRRRRKGGVGGGVKVGERVEWGKGLVGWGRESRKGSECIGRGAEMKVREGMGTGQWVGRGSQSENGIRCEKEEGRKERWWKK